MSALCHVTDFDHAGALGEDVMDDQVGSPERLIDVTVQPRLTATLHIRDPSHRSMNEGSVYKLDRRVYGTYLGIRYRRRLQSSSTSGPRDWNMEGVRRKNFYLVKNRDYYAEGYYASCLEFWAGACHWHCLSDGADSKMTMTCFGM